MLMQRDTQKLRDDINFIDVAVQTVADRNVDKTVLGRQGTAGFARIFVKG
jgi:hypothetical protein